jgi:hypothetical protein
MSDVVFLLLCFGRSDGDGPTPFVPIRPYSPASAPLSNQINFDRLRRNQGSQKLFWGCYENTGTFIVVD